MQCRPEFRNVIIGNIEGREALFPLPKRGDTNRPRGLGSQAVSTTTTTMIEDTLRMKAKMKTKGLQISSDTSTFVTVSIQSTQKGKKMLQYLLQCFLNNYQCVLSSRTFRGQS